MTRMIKGMTDNCPTASGGKHEWTGHGDPRYMWCLFCNQEKPTNMEFIGFDTEKQARFIVRADKVDFNLVILDGEQVHLLKGEAKPE